MVRTAEEEDFVIAYYYLLCYSLSLLGGGAFREGMEGGIRMIGFGGFTLTPAEKEKTGFEGHLKYLEDCC
jgi:hypothetical protein